MHFMGAWYGFTSSLTCHEKESLRHSIPVNTLTYCLCIIDVVFALVSFSASMPDPVIKYSIS